MRPLSRSGFFLFGSLLLLVKFALDWFVSERLFAKPWNPSNYIFTSQWLWRPRESAQTTYLLTLLAFSVPFVWIGSFLTLRRLRSCGLSPWLVVLFFVPLIKFLFFALLVALPAQSANTPESTPQTAYPDSALGRWIPHTATGSAVAAMLASLLLGVSCVTLSTKLMADCGVSLFAGLPFCMGFVAVLLYGWHQPRRLGPSIAVAMGSLLTASLVLLGFALEGAICLLMAAPIAMVLAALGALLAHAIQANRWRSKPPLLSVASLLTPALMGLEHVAPPTDPLFPVCTSIIVDAPPQRVWQHVLTFPELPPPTDWIFKTGIAYPIRARINGNGPGAIRYCEFSTGPFVEPIEIWDEPRLLKFSVTQNPPPMEEWTPYSAIHPAHLDGFLVSKGGQFKLTALEDGRTRLEGTTWYHHHLQPALYWKLISDTLIHKIHLQVLTHVKNLAESTTTP